MLAKLSGIIICYICIDINNYILIYSVKRQKSAAADYAIWKRLWWYLAWEKQMHVVSVLYSNTLFEHQFGLDCRTSRFRKTWLLWQIINVINAKKFLQLKLKGITQKVNLKEMYLQQYGTTSHITRNSFEILWELFKGRLVLLLLLKVMFLYPFYAFGHRCLIR